MFFDAGKRIPSVRAYTPLPQLGRGLVDAATSLAAPDLLSAGLWPLTAPSLSRGRESLVWRLG